MAIIAVSFFFLILPFGSLGIIDFPADPEKAETSYVARLGKLPVYNYGSPGMTASHNDCNAEDVDELVLMVKGVVDDDYLVNICGGFDPALVDDDGISLDFENASKSLCVDRSHPSAGSPPFIRIRGYECDILRFIDEHEGVFEYAEKELEKELIPMVDSESDSPIGTEEDIELGNESHFKSNLRGSRSTPYWNLDRIDQLDGLDNQFHAFPEGGKGVHVYVFDSGILGSHVVFGDRVIPTLEYKQNRLFRCHPSSSKCAMDTNGHGTHVAGTVGGDIVGIARGVYLHAVKLCGDDGGCAAGGFTKALDWVMQHGQKPAIVSASLGGSGTSPVEAAMIEAAVKQGIPVVVAAGNDRRNACGYSPAGAPYALTVGSTARGDRISSFSNLGRCVDIFAPGSEIVSASHRGRRLTATLSGTSMSCPHVTGALAVMMAKRSHRTGLQVVEELLRVATRGVVKGNLYNAHDKFLYTGR